MVPASSDSIAVTAGVPTHAIFVGEPTGSSPNFVGETSHATDVRTWIPPTLYVPETFAAFRVRRDPALEAILAYPRRAVVFSANAK